jgi:cytidylate kinase
MTKKHIITIAGRPGSGKSTTAKLVAAELGFEHFSSGDLFRALGRERGVDVLQANKVSGVVEDLDALVDGKLQEIGRAQDKKVIDSRTAWHWIPNSFKVFLDLDLLQAASRILEELSEDRVISEEVALTPAQYAKQLEHRLRVETDRYKKIYDIDPYDMKNYDLVINTGENGVTEVAKTIIEKFSSWIKD